MDFPKVSIITVVYNAKKALEITLETIFAINYPNKEIIIVDGASNDGTTNIIEQNSSKIDRWVSEPDQGIYDAMNKGLLMATGDYVWFINAGDTVYDPFILQQLFKGREQFCDLYYGETLVQSSNGDTLGLRGKKPPHQLRWSSFKRGMTVCHQSILVKRNIAPLYDLTYRYSADFDWVVKILKSGATVYNTRRILSVFEEGGATTQNHLQSLKERWSIMVKYYGRFQTIVSHIRFCLNLFRPKYRNIKSLNR